MVNGMVLRIGAFYNKHLPIGDRLGEMFYAVWMVVVSLGILGSTELDRGAIAYVILIAFMVNIAWGLIDGVSVMHTRIIERARIDKLVFDLRTKKDEGSRAAALNALEDTVTSGLGAKDREKVLDMIIAGSPGDDPTKRGYYPNKADWSYALGILAIDVLLVFPLIAPLVIWADPFQALYISRLIATVLFAILGAAYARNLNRRRWLAALFLGTLCFCIFSLAFLAGW